MRAAETFDDRVLARVSLLFGGAALVVVGELLGLTHVRACESERAAVCWAGPVLQVPLVVGLLLMVAAAGLWPRHRSLRWWDGPIVLLVAAVMCFVVLEVSDAVNPGDDAWDGRDGPVNVLVWTLIPLSVFLTYFTLRMRSAVAIAAAILATALPFILLVAAVVVSGGGS